MTETRTTNINPVYFVLIAVFLWSTGRLFIKLTTMDAYQVTFFLSLFAAFTVLILTRKDGLKINAFGIFTSIIYALLLFLFVWATKKTTAANGIAAKKAPSPRNLSRDGLLAFRSTSEVLPNRFAPLPFRSPEYMRPCRPRRQSTLHYPPR